MFNKQEVVTKTYWAARLQEHLADSPIVEIIPEGQGTHGILQVELASAVEVENRVEWAGMAVKEISKSVFRNNEKI